MKVVLLSFLLVFFSLTANAASKEKDFERMISAIDKNNVSQVKVLLSNGVKPNLTVDSRASPTFLTHASYRGHNDIIRVLVAAGADLEAIDGDGFTPLMTAVFGNRTETVQLLLGYRVNVNVVGARGETPLSLANDSKNKALIAMLVKAGAKE